MTEEKPKLLPALFKKGDRVEHTDKRDGKTVYGTVKSCGRKAPFTVTMIQDGGEYMVSGPFFLFKKSDQPLPAEPPSPMDRWSVKGYKEIGGDETPMFTAKILKDGKVVGSARNEGSGGSNLYVGLNRYGIDGFVEDATAWAKQYGMENPFEADALWIDWYVKHRPYGVSAAKFFADFRKMVTRSA